MEDVSSLAYSEVYEILNIIENEYVKRIPKKIINFLEEEREKNYNPIIEINRSLNEQNLKRETMVLLAILNYNYWCDSEEEKKTIEEELIKNNRIKEEEEKRLKEKYNPDNIFKKHENEKINNYENEKMIIYKKQNVFKKILIRIKNFFKIKE